MVTPRTVDCGDTIAHDSVTVRKRYQSSNVTKPIRKYHNVEHIYQMILNMKHFYQELTYPRTVLFAIFFHDYIYDPKVSQFPEVPQNSTITNDYAFHVPICQCHVALAVAHYFGIHSNLCQCRLTDSYLGHCDIVCHLQSKDNEDQSIKAFENCARDLELDEDLVKDVKQMINLTSSGHYTEVSDRKCKELGN